MAGSGVGLLGSGLTLELEKLALLGIGAHDSYSLKGSCCFLCSLSCAHLGSRWIYPMAPLYHAGEEGGQGWHLCHYNTSKTK